MKKLLLIAVVAVAGLALAKQQLDINVSRYLAAFTNGLLVAPESLNTSDSKMNANRITRALGGSATIDFAAAASLCEDSSAITVTGARAGDACVLGAPASIATADAGAEGDFSCYVSAANAVKVRFCAKAYEDPASETYYVRVISSQ